MRWWTTLEEMISWDVPKEPMRWGASTACLITLIAVPRSFKKTPTTKRLSEPPPPFSRLKAGTGPGNAAPRGGIRYACYKIHETIQNEKHPDH